MRKIAYFFVAVALSAALALGQTHTGGGAGGGVAGNLSTLTNPTAINLSTLTFAGAAGITAGGTSNVTFTPGTGGKTIVTGELDVGSLVSNDGFNSSFSFTAGASGFHAPIASIIQFQPPASITGHNRVLAGVAPSVISFPVWSAGVNGAATFNPTPTAIGAAFTQADVGVLFTVTGCGATGTITQVNSGSGTGGITAIAVAAVNPGTSACSTGAGQAITGGHGNSATVNIATVLPVSTESMVAAASVGMSGFGATFDGGGSALSTGTAYITIPHTCTISAVNLLIDQGAATFTVWKIATGTALPTVTQNISTSGLTITGQTASHSTDVSDFSTHTGVVANDIVAVHIVPSGGATWAQDLIECDRTY